MAELKTKLNNASVDEFIKSFKDVGIKALDQILAKSVKTMKTSKA